MDASSFSSSSFSSSSYGSLITSDPEAGFSGATSSSSIPRSATMLGSLSSSRPGRLFSNGFDDDDEDYEPRHFLDSCSLCRKPLARNCDIFMYRGDTPFCSEECRRERIEIDEAKEKSWKRLSVKTSISRSKKEEEQQLQKKKKIHVRASTVVAG